MGRPPKLTIWSAANALDRNRTLQAAADELGVHRRTLERFRDAHKDEIAALLERFTAPFAAPQQQGSHPRLTEEEITALEKLGLPRHDCSGDGCTICLKFLDEFEAEPQPPQCECGRAGCVGDHKLNPASVGLAPKPQWSRLANSYAPRKKLWER